VAGLWFSSVHRFPPPIKLTILHSWNFVESGTKHHNLNPLTSSFWNDCDRGFIFQLISSISYSFRVKFDCSKTCAEGSFCKLAPLISCCARCNPLF
jgi:hypothetical protein